MDLTISFHFDFSFKSVIVMVYLTPLRVFGFDVFDMTDEWPCNG